MEQEIQIYLKNKGFWLFDLILYFCLLYWEDVWARILNLPSVLQPAAVTWAAPTAQCFWGVDPCSARPIPSRGSTVLRCSSRKPVTENPEGVLRRTCLYEKKIFVTVGRWYDFASYTKQRYYSNLKLAYYCIFIRPRRYKKRYVWLLFEIKC